MRIYLSLILLVVVITVFASENAMVENASSDEYAENKVENVLLLPWYMERLYKASPPLGTELIDGKVIITEIQHEALLHQGLKVGMEITEINGMNVIMYADKYVRPYATYASSEEMVNQVYGVNLLMGYINDQIVLKMDNGQVYPVKRNYDHSVENSDSRNTKIIIEKVK